MNAERKPPHCSITTARDVARMGCQGSMAHAEMSEGVLFTSSMLHRFGYPTITLSWRTSSCPSPAPAALPLFEILAIIPPDRTAASPSSVTREGVGVMGVDSKRMKSASWL